MTTDSTKERKWRVNAVLGGIYLLLVVIFFAYNGIFDWAQTLTIEVINLMPLNGNTYPDFLQGLLIFCSLLFGFYSIILVESIQKSSTLIKRHVKRLSSKYRRQILYGIIILFLFFVPFYYLLSAISDSLTGIGYYGVLSINSSNNTALTNQNVYIFHEIVRNAATGAFNATWYIFIDILIYTLIEIGAVDYIIINIEKYLEARKNSRK